MLRRTGALIGVLAMAVLSAPAVAAEPDVEPPPGGDAVAAATTLGLRELGASDTLSFFIPRDVASTSVGFPVPPGMAPAQLIANVELPINLRYGNVAVSQDGRTLVRMELPAVDGAELAIPLAGARVFGNYLNLTVTVTAVPIDGYCWDFESPVRLSNARVSFAGQEMVPTTVADFVSPVARRVTIGVPAKPSLDESSAAIQIAAIMAGRYGGQNPEVAVVPLPDGASALPGRPGPFERRIVVKEGEGKGLSLQSGPDGPSLLVSGTGPDLTDQAVLLGDDALRYALSAKSDVRQLPESQVLLSNNTTLQALNKTGLSSEALWPQVGIEVDQSRFAQPIGDIRMRLIGSYTPLPGNFGGEVIVSAGGETIDRWPTDAAGVIDRTITVPNKLVKRTTTVNVRVHTTGQTGNCGEHLPMELRIDGSTEINVNPVTPPMPPGFQSLPQALMPRVRVGIGADAFGDTARAAQILAGLQRSSAVPLATEAAPLDEAISGSDPAVLVSSGGWTDGTIALPFSADQGRVTISAEGVKGESVTLELDPAITYGSLQTVFDGQRTLLVATSNGSPGQLDELLRWAAAEPGRWSALNGRALISVPGKEPVIVPNPPIELTQERASYRDEHDSDWFWPVITAIAAAAVAGGVAILLRARRSQRQGDPTPE